MSFLFEKTTITFKDGTMTLIDKYCEQYPDRWENRSHFIRCALEREFRRLRREGIYGGETK